MSLILLGSLPCGACFLHGGHAWIVVEAACHGTLGAMSAQGTRKKFVATSKCAPIDQRVFLKEEKGGG